MTLRAVLFDAAGTLMDPREPVPTTYARVARAHGVELSEERIGPAFAAAFGAAPLMVFPGEAPQRVEALEREWWREIVGSTFRGVDPQLRIGDFDALFDALWTTFSDPDQWCARPGAREALAELRARRIATAVVSNFDRRLRRILEGLGLAPLLDAIVLPSDAGAAKPDPRIFRSALERLGAAADQAVHVGDCPERDAAGGRAAGIRTVDVDSLATLADLPARLDALEEGTHP